MKFTKIQGAGNDYLFIDARNKEDAYNWPSLSRAMSDRHFGVGADGIILALNSDKAPIRMRIFNADGSEGEVCGNGIRGLAKYVLERGIVPPDTMPLEVETMRGILSVKPTWDKDKVHRCQVLMGEPSFKPELIPVIIPQAIQHPERWKEKVIDYPLDVQGRNLGITCVSMGNPHAVVFLEGPVDEFPLEQIGPKVERHPLFPRRVNFEIANVLGRDRIKARVWERGSGITLACGTGACAVAVASRLHGFTDDTVEVALPGGLLTVQWPVHGQVLLEGPTQEVFEGEWVK
ncbi:MAG: diaminopimelate epimerase [Chloroflexi bacterium]|nr:diaminopimelate epimerase [Chloroflexota bacterium]